MITFASPRWLYLLIIIPLYVAWYIWKRRGLDATVQVSSLDGLRGVPRSWKSYFRHVPPALRMGTLACAIVVMARPQSTNGYREENIEGINIVMVLDISGSMLAQDFKPDRLEAAKDVAQKFIAGRENDNIGLVIFAGESFTQCPLTTDHTALANLFNDVRTGMLEDGTAIGSGLATAVNRIKDAKGQSKVAILLTDGENNRGQITPLKAAEIAATFGVRVYTIGVGTRGMAPFPVRTAFGIQYQDVEVKIDEELLTQMAQMTGGKYFRATDKKSLESIYAEIDQLEKTILDVREYTKRTEEYLPWAIACLGLLLLEMLLRGTVLRSLP